MNRKYVLTDETKIVDGHVLHRIKAVRSFRDVLYGDLGGFIMTSRNLSHKGNCWVYDDACVYENARVYDNAKVHNSSLVRGDSQIFDYGSIYENARVYDNAKIFGYAKVYDNAKLFNNVKVYGNAKVFEDASIFGNAEVFENAKVYGYSFVGKNAKICGYAKVYNNQVIYYGVVTKDILKEKNWKFVLKCLEKNIQINDNKFVLYEEIIKTRNKNIFLSENGNLITKKNENNNFIRSRFTFNKVPYKTYFVKYELNLNDIKLINGFDVFCKKAKVLDIVKGEDLYEKKICIN